MTYSRDERLALAALLDKTDPQAPTLCSGWEARDLVAHLVLRERRPDAGLGELGGPLKARTDRMRADYLSRYSFPELISMFRSGPPRRSVFAIPGADEAINTVEHFVHHEDLRRATPGWSERELEPGMSDALWKRIRIARLLLRSAPTGVVLARDDSMDRVLAKNGTPSVTVTGTPAELTLWLSGRARAANVTYAGTDEAVARLDAWRR